MTSQLQISGPERLKRTQEQVGANGKELGDQRPQEIDRTLGAMEEEDQPQKDSNVYKGEVQHLTTSESEHSSDVNFFLSLPDIPFNLFVMKLSITHLRTFTQVSSSLKKRILRYIWGNPARKNDLRIRIKRAMEQYPSNEDISNAMWLSKYDFYRERFIIRTLDYDL